MPVLSSNKAAEQKSLEELFRVAHKGESHKTRPTSSDTSRMEEEGADGKTSRQIKPDFKEMVDSGVDIASTSAQVKRARWWKRVS